MHHEIENLLRAYIEEANRESRLIQDVLTALATGSAARQRMVRDLSNAAIQASTPRNSTLATDTATFATDVNLAISRLRGAQAPYGAH